MRLTPLRLAIALAFVGSSAFIAYAVLRVRDTSQIPMLSSGFGVLAIACAAVALGAAIEMWRSARSGRSGRAMALAIGGGVFGFAAIACFAAAVVFALLWGS
jgi:chromate transport protein ChrA